MYAITIQTHRYAGTYGTDNRELLLLDGAGAVDTFGTLAGARECARNCNSGRALGHGQYATPTYRVVKVGSTRYERLYRRTFAAEAAERKSSLRV